MNTDSLNRTLFIGDNLPVLRGVPFDFRGWGSPGTMNHPRLVAW